jgi:3-oxoacyl-[acyl-carrier-protein] synthase-1
MPELYVCDPDDPDFEDGTEFVAAPISWIAVRRYKDDPAKWLALIAHHAFTDFMDHTSYTDALFPETGLFVSLPPMMDQNRLDISGMATMKDAFIYHFHNMIENDIFPCEDYSFEGHTGVFSLIEKALKVMDEGKITRAIVGGVESCLFPEWLEKLDKNYRIRSRRNIDGYIPGEAAAFVLIEKESRGGDGQTAAFRINGLSSAIETAGGLKHVVSDLAGDTNDPPVIVGDLNGESKRMKEWGNVWTALGEQLGNPVCLEHPADILGDVGAASGAVLLIMAMYMLQTNHGDRHSAIVFTASDFGCRRGIRLICSLGACNALQVP